MPRRFFYVHVQKAAGTEIRERLKRNFAPEAMYPDRSDGDLVSVAPQVSVAQLLARWSVRKDEIRIITGHFPFATTELLDAEFVTLSVLREPVERVLSHLRHHRKLTPGTDSSSLGHLYDEVLTPEFFHNHMVKMFSLTAGEVAESAALDRWAVLKVVDLTPERLETAKRNVERLDVLGLQDHLPEFCEELTDALRMGPRRAAVRQPHTRSRTRPTRCAGALPTTTRSTSSSGSTPAPSTRAGAAAEPGPSGQEGGQSVAPNGPTEGPAATRIVTGATATNVCARCGFSIPTPKPTGLDAARPRSTSTTCTRPPMPMRSPCSTWSVTGARSGAARAGRAVVELHERQAEAVGRGFERGRRPGRRHATGRDARAQPAERHGRSTVGFGTERGRGTGCLGGAGNRQHDPPGGRVDEVLAARVVARVDDVPGDAHEEHRERRDADDAPPRQERVDGERERGQQQRGGHVQVATRPRPGRSEPAPVERGDHDEHERARQHRHRYGELVPCRVPVVLPQREHTAGDQHRRDQPADTDHRTHGTERAADTGDAPVDDLAHRAGRPVLAA